MYSIQLPNLPTTGVRLLAAASFSRCTLRVLFFVDYTFIDSSVLF